MRSKTLKGVQSELRLSHKSVMSNLFQILVSALTNKAVGSEYVIKSGTDGFSRRRTKNSLIPHLILRFFRHVKVLRFIHTDLNEMNYPAFEFTGGFI
jgi:hypothetical protein